MQTRLLVTATKSGLLVSAIMLVQHLDEIWRGGLSLSPAYLLITLLVSSVFILFSYWFHLWRMSRQSEYQPEWLYSPVVFIALSSLLIVLTIWRG